MPDFQTFIAIVTTLLVFMGIMTQLKEGDFFLPYNQALIERAREMRKNPTPAVSDLALG